MIPKLLSIVLVGALLGGSVARPAAANPGFLSAGQKAEISASWKGRWLDSLRASGLKQKPAILLLSAPPTSFTIPSSLPITELTGESILYLPDSVEVVAVEPKVYGEKNFSDQIQDHYVYNYILYGILFAVVAASALTAQP